MLKHRFDYFVSCPIGLENCLEEEIKLLGVEKYKVLRGGIKFEAFHEIALKIILYSRIASRVFKYLFSFDVKNEKDLYLQIAGIKWKSLMDVSETFKLSTLLGDLPQPRSFFTHSQFINLKFKDALVDNFRNEFNQRPSVDKDHPDHSFLLRIESTPKDRETFNAIILLDLTGNPLNQRGYRKNQGLAPVKENLAAGILHLMKWNPLDEVFLDAMTGSGTFPIEALMLVANIPPSFLKTRFYQLGIDKKPWTFLNSNWFKKDPYLQENFEKFIKTIEEETKNGINFLRKNKVKIIANDISEINLLSAKENIRTAGFEEFIALKNSDALHLEPDTSKKTLFFANPPYGERLKESTDKALEDLYSKIGDQLKQKFKSNRAVLFVGNLDLIKKIGLKTSKKHILYNGSIEARLVEISLY